MSTGPILGVHYPGSLADFRAWFPDDSACLDYLDWLRWRDGFLCPHCAGVSSWQLSDSRQMCAECGRRVSVTAGTIFHRTRTPLTVWFEAAWLLTSQKSGVSALGLQRVLGLGSYQTAWTMLHRFRLAMVVPERGLLSGEVEVDETFIGGKNKPGKRGRGAAGKALVGLAVELDASGGGFGRIRMQVIPDATGPTLRDFITTNIAPGSTVITDALNSYAAITTHGFGHTSINVKRSGAQAHEVLPGVHRVASLLKRWLDGTLQGAVRPEHLQSYLDEFVFRFNRRNSRKRGLLFFRLLEQAVRTDPISYRRLVAVPTSKAVPPRPPAERGMPGSLAGERLDRPWRAS